MVRSVMEDVKKADDEHNAFWVSVTLEDENVLEIDKELNITGVFEDDLEKQYRLKLENWEQGEKMFELLLSKDIEQVKDFFK